MPESIFLVLLICLLTSTQLASTSWGRQCKQPCTHDVWEILYSHRHSACTCLHSPQSHAVDNDSCGSNEGANLTPQLYRARYTWMIVTHSVLEEAGRS
jgi:hypothetical protein